MKKNLTVFDEMIRSCGCEDVNIAKDIESGFDLMGHLPSSGVFQKSSSFASLMPEHVRNVSGQTRTAVWNSTRACGLCCHHGGSQQGLALWSLWT